MDVSAFLANISNVVVRPALFLLFGIAFITFIWGVVGYIRDADNATERANGVRSMIWGIVGMLIMVSVYGIISIVYGTIGGNPSALPGHQTGPYLPENTVTNPL